MAFVKEYLSEEDKKKYGNASTWSVDRERGFYLFGSGLNRDKMMMFELHNLNDGVLLMRVNANENTIIITPPDQSIGFAGNYVQRYEIYSVITTANSNDNLIKYFPILENAIIEHCSGKPNLKYPNIKVEVKFSNQIGGNK